MSKTASSTLLAMGMAAILFTSNVSAQENLHTASLGGTNPTSGQDHASSAMRIFDETRPPVGYVQFCSRHTEECRGGTSDPRRAQLTPDRWLELMRVNTLANQHIAPVTDQDLYNTVEYWTYPQSGSGDCEDYVLVKKRELVSLGWPAESLLITVVKDEIGDGHAVLTVATDHGDFVLDNKTSAILRWSDTPYTFKKRQSMTHPYIWVSLAPEKPWFENILPATPH